MLEKIPVKFQKIPGNAIKDSGEYYQRFWGVFKKIPGNVRKDPGECSGKLRGMFSILN